MKKKTILYVLAGLVTLVLLIIFISNVFIEPWVGRKIQRELNAKNKDYIFEIANVNFMPGISGIKLEKITIRSKLAHKGLPDFIGNIVSIKITGINLSKAIFKKEFIISKMIISNCTFLGKIPFSREEKPPIISSLNIRIDSILFDNINLVIENTTNAKAYSINEGILTIYNLKVEKHDTLSTVVIRDFNFKAQDILSVSSDSMYTFKGMGLIYSSDSASLAVDSFCVQPNYGNSKFTSRNKFETDCFEAGFSKIYVNDFSAAEYFRHRSIVSSYIQIGKMNVSAFRDKRKKFRHINRPVFQEMIYNYAGLIDIDSIGIRSGNITYTEHAEKANKPGKISFNEINLNIYKISNDTIYKNERAYLEIKAEAMLMGKGKMNILLKGQIFDTDNTFSVKGTLLEMEASELNPMLEKNAFLYATSGKIDAMKFSFTANNTKASGNMTLLYHGLDFAVKNKRTDDTTALLERIISLFANEKLLDSNPIPGNNIRVGIIDNERDPEKFLFNYCFKSILTGIKSSIVKSPKRKSKE